jgi:hypothetical protein
VNLGRATVPVRTQGIAWQIVDGELVLLLIDNDELVGINESGAAIWDLTDGQRDVNSIASELADRYEVDPEATREDAQRFLDELTSLGAITWADR